MKLNDWKPETRSLIDRLVKSGFTIKSQCNGEYESKVADIGIDKFLDDLIACDETRLSVVAPDGEKLSLLLVFGNDPGELVCNHHDYPLLNRVTEKHHNVWFGRPQPKLRD